MGSLRELLMPREVRSIDWNFKTLGSRRKTPISGAEIKKSKSRAVGMFLSSIGIDRLASEIN